MPNDALGQWKKDGERCGKCRPARLRMPLSPEGRRNEDAGPPVFSIAAREGRAAMNARAFQRFPESPQLL
jgi:hypothetical protein